MAFWISFRDLFDARRGSWNDRFPQAKKVALRRGGRGQDTRESVCHFLFNDFHTRSIQAA